MARAREKARLSKIAKSQAKADQEKQFAKFQESVAKPPSPAREAAATAMSESESEPSLSPVKKKKVKRAPKKNVGITRATIVTHRKTIQQMPD